MARLATDGFSRPAAPTAPLPYSSLPYRGQRAGAGSRAGKAPWGSDWYQ